jgi:ribulose-phosphate 3-epimerase
MNIILSPSILNANFLRLEQQIELLNSSEADWIHLDIMDGVFVPNISVGQSVVTAIRTVSKKPLDVHLMIVNPERYIDDFVLAGSSIVTVHYEASIHLHRTIQYIKSKGVKAGVAINPHTPVSALEEIIGDVDLVLNMTVNPGFGGQKLIEGSVDKIKRLKELVLAKNSKAIIQVDGGVDLSNIQSLINAGADAFVAGSSIFKSSNPLEVIASMKGMKVG